MNQRNIKIGMTLYEVVTQQQFALSPGLYDRSFTAILFDERIDIYGNLIPAFVLPFGNMNDLERNTPGIYGVSFETNDSLIQPCFNVIYPFHFDMSGKLIIDRPEYLASNMLDTTNLNKMQELIDLDAKYREFEFDIITAGDNATIFRIMPDDTPEMVATKKALNAKHIDIDKYRSRIGSTFANDKRFLQNSPSITFNKVKALFPALDLKCTMIIDNASPDVPNPIPHPITVNITDDVVINVDEEQSCLESSDSEDEEDYEND